MADAPRLAKAEGVGVAPRNPTLGADVGKQASRSRCERSRVLTVTEICTYCNALSKGVAQLRSTRVLCAL